MIRRWLNRWVACLLLFCCFVSVAKAGLVEVDLAGMSHLNLVPSMVYLDDPGRQYTFADLRHQDAESLAWQTLRPNNLLRFGYVDKTIWLMGRLRTLRDQATEEQTVYLDFHKIIDKVQVEVYENGVQVRVDSTLSKAIEQRFLSATSNGFALRLRPGKDYVIYVRIDSENSIIGEVGLWGETDYLNAQKQELYGLAIYFCCILFAAMYGFFAHASTQFYPFKYHSLYALSMLGFQGSQYDYISRLLNVESVAVKNGILCCFLIVTIVCLIKLVMSLISARADNKWLFRFASWMVFIAISSAPLILIFTFKLMVAYVLSIALICTGVAIVYVILSVKRARNDAILVMTALLVLSPSSFLQILSRFGIIESSFVTEYLLMFSVAIEMLVISIIFFYQIRRLKSGYLQAQYFDVDSRLPNISSLKMAAENITKQGAEYLYIRVWFSGLDRMEMLMGAEYYEKFIWSLAIRLKASFEQCDFVYKVTLPDKNSHCLFTPEKSVVGAFLSTLEKSSMTVCQSIVLDVLAVVKKEYQYNMDIRTLIVGALSGPDKCINQVLQDSHAAMLHSYKNNWELEIYSDEVGAKEHQQFMLVSDFRQSLLSGQLFLLWQPQFDAGTLNIVGMEVLTRWRHPLFGMVSPETFIPLLEDSMQISHLTHWVIDHVFRALVGILEFFPDIDVSVNLSVQDLLDRRLIGFLDQEIALYPGLQKYITLEVTESMMINDGQVVLETVLALQERGFRFSIDDFGAGYTSLGYLELLPANELKIDKRFVDSSEQANSQAIVSSVIDMAKKLNMTVVVEGIENQQQASLFIGLGAERLQGWRYAYPMPLQDVIDTFSREALVPVNELHGLPAT